MKPVVASDGADGSAADPGISRRARSILRAEHERICARTDRMFVWLLLLQWVAGIVTALVISPKTWSGTIDEVHIHVWTAVFVGGAISSLPIALALRRPGRFSTRCVVACAQMLWSALLIHLSGGRIETHFHVFGSLAFLSFYRDWRVLIPATAIIALDHMVRGIFWPQSVFGVLGASQWRWVEHAAWVLFEDYFLILSCRRGFADLGDAAHRQATLESTNEIIEAKVIAQTTDIAGRESLFRSLSQSSPLGVFRMLTEPMTIEFANARCSAILAVSSEEFAATGWWGLVHPDDRDCVLRHWSQATELREDYSQEFRIEIAAGCKWIHLRAAPLADTTAYVGTIEDITARREADEENAQLNRRMVLMAREAGMAELATGVLHNVGNALNSVNIAATVVADRIRGSKLGNLRKILTMIEDEKGHLDEFLAGDERGANLLPYFHVLVEALEGDHRQMTTELEQLQDVIEHIKAVVSVQQDVAKGAGVREPVDLATIMDDAEKFNASRLDRHGIALVRDYDRDVIVTTDRHRVLQIIINLISNAKHALDVDDGRDRVITLRVERQDDRVLISVEDTGAGIDAVHMPRLFQHGFTTKRTGHGFGLHNSAAAAQELGGELTAHSDGPGRGARFTLIHPADPEPSSPVAAQSRAPASS